MSPPLPPSLPPSLPPPRPPKPFALPAHLPRLLFLLFSLYLRYSRLFSLLSPSFPPHPFLFHPSRTRTRSSSSSSSSSSSQGQLKAHGRHITLDYTSFFVDAREGAALTLSLIRAAVKEAGVREVHSHIVVLGGDGLSPPGFTGKLKRRREG